MLHLFCTANQRADQRGMAARVARKGPILFPERLRRASGNRTHMGLWSFAAPSPIEAAAMFSRNWLSPFPSVCAARSQSDEPKHSDFPCSILAFAYQTRCSAATFSRSVKLWYQVILCKNRLHKFLVRPGLSESPHVLEIPRREPLHVRKGLVQVRRQTINDLSTPLFSLLSLQYVSSDPPIQEDQLAVYRD